MTDRMNTDARNLKKLIREAEALADESMIAFARLRQAMLSARQNPEVEVHTGQRALMRLAEAESQALAVSNNLLRVHHELSTVAREQMVDDVIPTEVPDEGRGSLAAHESAQKQDEHGPVAAAASN
jgi:hypothetical protein